MEIERLILKESGSVRDVDLIRREAVPPRAHEIQVRPLFVGVCGTDLHLVQNQSSVPHRISDAGLVLGHEGVAQVTRIGSDVEYVREGDIVALESLVCCSQCRPCREGHFNQCENANLLGAQSDGLFTGLTNVPASAAHVVSGRIRDERDFIAYACLEPAAVAFHACENAGLKPGDDVLIFGAGPIGYFCAMLSRKLFGANRIFVREPLPARRQLARPWCTQVFDIDEDLSSIEPNVIFEASGVLENVTGALGRVKPNGAVILLARSGRPLTIDRVDHVITNAISIRGSRGHLGGAFQKLISLQDSGAIDLAEAVTEVLPSIRDLKMKLENPGDSFFERHGKVMVKINDVR